MKKILLILLVVAMVAGGYFFYKKEQGVSPEDKNASTTTPSTSPVSAKYKDGSYVSDVFQTDRGFGPIQVKVVINNGKITDVQFLQFPNKPGNTTKVSEMALPLLKQEAITAQSAQVDNISGATQTADAVRLALSSALALAE